jgi:hypothetical protein
MIMNKHRNTTRLWSRTTKALGKFFAGMVTLPVRHPLVHDDEVYPRFPMF